MRYLVILLTLCLSLSCSMNSATKGALTGSALGAGTGAIIGSQTGHAGPGIAIGAAAGALGGALIGNAMDQQEQERQSLQRKVDDQQRLIDENRKLIEDLKRGGADVYASDRGVVVNLPDVLFEFGKADLTNSARKTIGDIARVVGSNNRRISVEGHTDSIGTVMYNKKLSYDRAENVANELNRKGITNQRLRVRGFGEGYPIATNNTDAGRARNRRVEVIIENNPEEEKAPINNPNAAPGYQDQRY